MRTSPLVGIPVISCTGVSGEGAGAGVKAGKGIGLGVVIGAGAGAGMVMGAAPNLVGNVGKVLARVNLSLCMLK